MDGFFEETELAQEKAWKKEWKGMPEFIQEDQSPWKSIIVHFASPGDMQAFSELVEQTITPKTQSLWYPTAEIVHMMNKRYIDES